VYVVPAAPEQKATVLAALQRKVEQLQTRWPGLGIQDGDQQLRLTIPDEFRIGHESHFAQVTKRFFEYLRAPQSMPSWENPNMLAKYYVTTKGVELSQSHTVRVPPR
jgi:hypothetical protein